MAQGGQFPAGCGGDGSPANTFDAGTEKGDDGKFHPNKATRVALQGEFNRWGLDLKSVEMDYLDINTQKGLTTYTDEHGVIHIGRDFELGSTARRDYIMTHELFHVVESRYLGPEAMAQRGSVEFKQYPTVSKRYAIDSQLAAMSLDQIDVRNTQFTLEAMADKVALSLHPWKISIAESIQLTYWQVRY